MRLSCGYETKKARVEMLPLIDVVFLLLVFFIYAMLSMVLHRGLKIDLPTAGSAMIEKSDYIAITIDADNHLFLNKEPVAADGLAERVRQLRNGEAKPVFINGDRQADLGLAIELLDDLKKSGIEEVSFSCAKDTP
ncbi:MAG: biopolymer transporter ExbD [Kiritimatiellales bacterium]|nr:biopolymer transporter ExbD [Kiritimatiellales bacterium]